MTNVTGHSWIRCARHSPWCRVYDCGLTSRSDVLRYVRSLLEEVRKMKMVLGTTYAPEPDKDASCIDLNGPYTSPSLSKGGSPAIGFGFRNETALRSRAISFNRPTRLSWVSILKAPRGGVECDLVVADHVNPFNYVDFACLWPFFTSTEGPEGWPNLSNVIIDS